MRISFVIALFASLCAGLSPARASAAAGEPTSSGVCVVVSGGEEQAVADGIARALDVASRRIDVRDPRQRALLDRECGRLIVAVGAQALAAARTTTGKAAIVATAPGAATVAASPTHSANSANSANSDRLATQVSRDLDPERALALLHQISPRVRRIGAVYDPARSAALVESGRHAARAAGLELVALPARSIREAVLAFHRFEGEVAVDALWILPDATTTVQETMYYALELAHFRSIAVVGLSQWYVSNGALFALVPRKEDPAVQVVAVAKQILRGEKPPAIAYRRDGALYLNLRTAERLGLRIPRDVREIAEAAAP